MNQNTFPDLSLFLGTIIIGLIIAGLYMVLIKIFFPAVAAGRTRKKLLVRMEFLERLFWPVFFIAVASSLIISHSIVGLAIGFFISGMLWKSISNYFLGLIYLTGNTYTIGQRIRYKDRQGAIKTFNNLTLEMEMEDGESLDIPYRYFADTAIVRTSPQSGVMSHTIKLQIAKPCNLEKEKQRIKKTLLALPWVLPNQKIVFEHISDETDRYLIKVIVHGIDKSHLYKVEHKIKAMYA